MGPWPNFTAESCKPLHRWAQAGRMQSAGGREGGTEGWREGGREGEPEMCLKGKGWGVETVAFKIAWNRPWAALCRVSPTPSWLDLNVQTLGMSIGVQHRPVREWMV